MVEERKQYTSRPHTSKERRFAMPLVYKIDVLAALKDKGYNTNRLRKEKLLAESTIQKLRKNEPISWANIAQICDLLGCQPGYFLENIAKREE